MKPEFRWGKLSLSLVGFFSCAYLAWINPIGGIFGLLCMYVYGYADGVSGWFDE